MNKFFAIVLALFLLFTPRLAIEVYADPNLAEQCDEAGEPCCQGGQGAMVCSDIDLNCNFSTGLCESNDNQNTSTGSANPNNTAELVQCEGQPGTVSTGIGCIPIGSTDEIATFFLRWGLGIAGGVALTMIGFASYRIATSQGDPRRLQGGQELLISAIGGLLMVILSVFLLRFIGVDLLGIF